MVKTGNIGKLWKILPYRRKEGGTAPGMTSKGMREKDAEIEDILDALQMLGKLPLSTANSIDQQETIG